MHCRSKPISYEKNVLFRKVVTFCEINACKRAFSGDALADGQYLKVAFVLFCRYQACNPLSLFSPTGLRVRVDHLQVNPLDRQLHIYPMSVCKYAAGVGQQIEVNRAIRCQITRALVVFKRTKLGDGSSRSPLVYHGDD